MSDPKKKKLKPEYEMTDGSSSWQELTSDMTITVYKSDVKPDENILTRDKFFETLESVIKPELESDAG